MVCCDDDDNADDCGDECDRFYLDEAGDAADDSGMIRISCCWGILFMFGKVFIDGYYNADSSRDFDVCDIL